MGKTPCVWKKMANRNGPNSFYKFNVILNEIRLFFMERNGYDYIKCSGLWGKQYQNITKVTFLNE